MKDMLERVATAPKTATFQMRINPAIRARAESVYADCGLTLTEAINIFIQQSINVEGLPFVVTPRSRAAKFEQSVSRLMSEINSGVASAAREDLRELRRCLVGEFGAAVAEKSVRKIVTDISICPPNHNIEQWIWRSNMQKICSGRRLQDVL